MHIVYNNVIKKKQRGLNPVWKRAIIFANDSDWRGEGSGTITRPAISVYFSFVPKSVLVILLSSDGWRSHYGAILPKKRKKRIRILRGVAVVVVVVIVVAAHNSFVLLHEKPQPVRCIIIIFFSFFCHLSECTDNHESARAHAGIYQRSKTHCPLNCFWQTT